MNEEFLQLQKKTSALRRHAGLAARKLRQAKANARRAKVQSKLARKKAKTARKLFKAAKREWAAAEKALRKCQSRLDSLDSKKTRRAGKRGPAQSRPDKKRVRSQAKHRGSAKTRAAKSKPKPAITARRRKPAKPSNMPPLSKPVPMPAPQPNTILSSTPASEPSLATFPLPQSESKEASSLDQAVRVPIAKLP